MVKLAQIVEKEFENLTLTIEFFVNNDSSIKCVTKYNYTCPKCAGYGCRSGGCTGGIISENLDLSNFNLPPKLSQQIKDKLLSLADKLE